MIPASHALPVMYCIDHNFSVFHVRRADNTAPFLIIWLSYVKPLSLNNHKQEYGILGLVTSPYATVRYDYYPIQDRKMQKYAKMFHHRVNPVLYYK